MLYEHAVKLARDLAVRLAPSCERIEIAGSIRRRKPDPHDIELVAIAKHEPIYDLYGHEIGERNLLDETLDSLVVDGTLKRGPKNGPRFKQFVVAPSGIMLDLFVVVWPAQWGVIYAIRTGPAHYSHWLVTKRQQGGPLPNDAYVRDGAVWLEGDDGQPLPMDTEESFFAFLELQMPAPQERTPLWSKKQ